MNDEKKIELALNIHVQNYSTPKSQNWCSLLLFKTTNKHCLGVLRNFCYISTAILAHSLPEKLSYHL